MKTISLSKANRAAEALKKAARKADTDQDDVLDRGELRRASKTVGKDAAKALNDYAAQHRALTMRDPEFSEEDARERANHMDVDTIDWAVKAGLEQLGKIDSYKGTKKPARPANKPDGFVTPSEVKNYHHTKGKLQMEARPLAEFTNKLKK